MDRNSKKWSVLGFDRNLQAEEWIADMEDRGLASYSVVGESIFVVGGQNYSTNVIEFLVRERLWRKRTSLAVGRGKHAAAVVKFNAAAADEEGGEKALISIVGGTNDSTSLSSCEVYDVSQDRWYKLPDLPERRGGPAAASLPGDSRVFVFGGCNGSRWLDSVVCCQLRADWREKAAIASSTDFWQSVARMRTARRGLAATHFRGKILVAGGWNEQGALSIVELFSPPDAACPRGQWTELAAMREPRWYFTLLTSADAVFALGSSSGSENTVEVFTAPKGSLGFGNGLISWTWLSRHPVETLSRIAGAASIRM
uniref:Influenza virus NS1A-binding protein n=2 Tax=Schistocephalus solidus TaxID=70667 RepID=A0A0V0J435_SCHSO